MNVKVWELVLVGLVAFGIGFWQLYDINKELKKDREKEKEAATKALAKPGTGEDSATGKGGDH